MSSFKFINKKFICCLSKTCVFEVANISIMENQNPEVRKLMAGCLLFYLFIFEYTADHTIISRLHMQKYKLLKPLWCLNVTCGETHVTLIWLFLCCKYFLFFSYFHEKNGLNLCWGSVHEGSYIFLNKVIHYSCISYYLPIFLSISVSTSLPWTLSHTHM